MYQSNRWVGGYRPGVVVVKAIVRVARSQSHVHNKAVGVPLRPYHPRAPLGLQMQRPEQRAGQQVGLRLSRNTSACVYRKQAAKPWQDACTLTLLGQPWRHSLARR